MIIIRVSYPLHICTHFIRITTTSLPLGDTHGSRTCQGGARQHSGWNQRRSWSSWPVVPHPLPSPSPFARLCHWTYIHCLYGYTEKLRKQDFLDQLHTRYPGRGRSHHHQAPLSHLALQPQNLCTHGCHRVRGRVSSPPQYGGCLCVSVENIQMVCYVWHGHARASSSVPRELYGRPPHTSWCCPW